MSLLLAVAVAVHLPWLAMELPLDSSKAGFHIFFASQYLHHWFNPWNVKWYAGFSQTTFPPLAQQWVALFARVIGLDFAYMAVQMIAIMLLVLGVYRFSRLWVSPRAASLAALAGVFLGSESLLVYSAGRLAMSFAAAVYLNALPFLYGWVRRGGWRSFLKAAALLTVAAAAHYGTLVFGSLFFALPVLVLASFDREWGPRVSAGAFLSRTIAIAVFAGALIGIVLLPFWIALIHNPVSQTPIPHPSHANYVLNPRWGLTYFVVPYGALILALPFVFFRGAAVARLRPLFFGFWIAFLIGLGGTTPVGPALLGRAYDFASVERFTYWATLLALPFAGALAQELIARFRSPAVIGLTLLAVFSCGLAVTWTIYAPNEPQDFQVKTVAEWLNRSGHDQYRYFTLGFGNKISRLAVLTDADSIDGNWNSGRTLPELVQYGGGPLTDSKDYGEPGLDALRAMLKDADRYGVKWVFVRDHSYDPLLYFSGWQAVDSVDLNTIVVWTKDGVPPATPINSPLKPPAWQGLMWGIFPFGSSLVAILLLLIPEKKRRSASQVEPVLAREENPIFGRLVS
ncbi:MAG TPA: hypothetical protein VGS10_17435 [Terracidiphilus sp.]|nr:hypothetical protein [Terracidiphilus sp.]